MNVAKHKLPNTKEALTFAELKLNQGYSNIRMITARSQRAKNYNITGEQVQVRYW